MGHLAALRLSEPAPIADLFLLALELDGDDDGDDDGGGGGGGSRAHELAQRAAALLDEKSEMLAEYLALEIATAPSTRCRSSSTATCRRCTARRASCGASSMASTGRRSSRASRASRASSPRCFRVDRLGGAPAEGAEGGGGGEAEAAKETANAVGGSSGDRMAAGRRREAACSVEWTIQHVLLPAMRRSYELPTSHATNGAVVQVASTEQLYRSLRGAERCHVWRTRPPDLVRS